MKCQGLKCFQDSSGPTHDIISVAQRLKEWLVSPQLWCPMSHLTSLLRTLTETSKSRCPNSLALLPVSVSGTSMHPAAETKASTTLDQAFIFSCQDDCSDFFNRSPMYTEPYPTQKIPSKGRFEHISHPTIKIFQWLSMLLNKDQTLSRGLGGSAWSSHSGICSFVLHHGPLQSLSGHLTLLSVHLTAHHPVNSGLSINNS